MTTALDVIKRAMRLAGVYSIGEEPSAEETANGLAALNGMVGEWSNNSLLIYEQATDQVTLSAADNQYTIGATGDVVSARPIKAVDASYVLYRNVSYPVSLLSHEQYNSISYKPMTAEFPRALWYQPDYPNGTITVYPTPTATSTLFFVSLKPFTEFAGATTVVSLPPGYFDALCFNLAVNYGAEFDGASIPQSVVLQARNTKRSIGRVNTRVPRLLLPSAVMSGRYNSRIIDGP